jgi:hypothetical protein
MEGLAMRAFRPRCESCSTPPAARRCPASAAVCAPTARGCGARGRRARGAARHRCISGPGRERGRARKAELSRAVGLRALTAGHPARGPRGQGGGRERRTAARRATASAVICLVPQRER